MTLLMTLQTPRHPLDKGAPKPEPKVSETEYAVFSVYITSAFTGRKGEDRVGNGVSKIVIINRTKSDMNNSQMEDHNDKPVPWAKASKFLRKQAPTLKQETIEKLREVGSQSAPLKSSFLLLIPYELVEAKEIEDIFKNGGWWHDFYKKYPGSQGYMGLSRIGFSPDGNQALFYVTNSCGGKCGSGTYVVMEKSEGQWKLVKEILIWVS